MTEKIDIAMMASFISNAQHARMPMKTPNTAPIMSDGMRLGVILPVIILPNVAGQTCGDCAIAFMGTVNRIYVSGSMDLFISMHVRIGGRGRRRRQGESTSGGLAKRSGAGRNNLPSVSLELSHKRPCRRTVSLADKEDDRRHPIGRHLPS